MTQSHKVIVQVGGIRYPVSTTEDKAYVESLGSEIDKMVQMILDHSRVSVNEALLLCCLQYLDAYRKTEESADHLRGQVAEYLDEAAKARAELAAAREEIAELEECLIAEGKKD